MLKQTPLVKIHKKLGATMVDFGGWLMPVYYTNVIDEHLTTREKAGLFDICHMGEIKIEGSKSQELVQMAVSKNIKDMPIEKVHLTVMCNETGGIIDDLTVYKLIENEYMLVTNASTKDKDLNQILKIKRELNLNDPQVKVTDISSQTAKLDLQGPMSKYILQRLTTVNLESLKFYTFVKAKILDTDAIISQSGYTGEMGYELYFSCKSALKIWNKLLSVGKKWGLKPIGLGARDTLRLECGMNLYGHEISEEIHPLQSRYGWVVSFDKEFVGKKSLEKIRDDGWTRQLVGFEMVSAGIPRNGYLVFKNTHQIGLVTSGTYSPTFKRGIGMAYVDKEYKDPDTEISIKIRENFLNARVIKLPFYKRR